MAQHSHSMRDNYAGGVSQYYTAVASTVGTSSLVSGCKANTAPQYRNPSFGAVRVALTNAFSGFYEREVLDGGARQRHLARCERRAAYIKSVGGDDVLGDSLTVLDLACGAGEVTSVLKEWEAVGRSLSPVRQVTAQPTTRYRVVGSTRVRHIPLPEDAPGIKLLGADPFTEQAFRASHPDTPFVGIGFDRCDELSLSEYVSARPNDERYDDRFDLCVISFALHLIAQDQSALYRCLSALSHRARWLMILSPHKQPLIKSGGVSYGWRQVDLPASDQSWRYVDSTEGGGEAGELVMERVHVRLYESQREV